MKHRAAGGSGSGPAATHYVTFRIFDIIERLVSMLVPWGSAVWIAYLLRGAIVALAGKTTLADIGLGMKASVTLPDAISYAFGIGGVGWGFAERGLRRRHIAETSQHIANLEKRIDPDRSSSRLTRWGTTRPEDK